MYRHIVVPLDGSALAETVLPHVRRLAAQGEITLLCVVAYADDGFIFSDPAILVALHSGVVSGIQSYLHDIAASFHAEGYTVHIEVREGTVADTILTVARERHADLIAMSTHGRGGMARWMLGSVAEKVLHHTHVPLVLVNPTV